MSSNLYAQDLLIQNKVCNRPVPLQSPETPKPQKCILVSEQFSEKPTGNIVKRRLLVNPYGLEIQTEFCKFVGENNLNSEKGGIYESPPDRYVPNSSPVKNAILNPQKNGPKSLFKCQKIH